MKNSLHYKLRISHTNCQKAIVHTIAENTDLRPGEPKILEFLSENEPCTQKEIAAGCSLDSASVTGILVRMESRNLVIRECKNGNRRSLYVSMTEYGKQMAQEAEKAFSLIDGIASAGLSDEELSEFMRMLDVINNILTHQGD